MLINCVAYQDGRKLADIEKRQISEYLAQPGCFVHGFRPGRHRPGNVEFPVLG